MKPTAKILYAFYRSTRNGYQCWCEPEDQDSQEGQDCIQAIGVFPVKIDSKIQDAARNEEGGCCPDTIKRSLPNGGREVGQKEWGI